MATGLANAIIVIRGIDMLSKPISAAAQKTRNELNRLQGAIAKTGKERLGTEKKINDLSIKSDKLTRTGVVRDAKGITALNDLLLKREKILLRINKAQYIGWGTTKQHPRVKFTENQTAELDFARKELKITEQKIANTLAENTLTSDLRTEDIKRASDEIDGLKTKVLELNKAETLQKATASLLTFQMRGQQVSAFLRQLGSSLASIGLMGMAGTLPIAGLGVSVAKEAIEFDKAMRNIQSISQQSDLSLEKLSERFRTMSKDLTQTVATPYELADAFYEIQSAAFYGADAEMILARATKTASAGLADQKATAKALAMALHAYNVGAEEATHYTDVMMRAVDIGIFRFEDLTQQMGDFIGAAGMLGVPIEEAMAALTTMTKRGIPIAEAATSLNRILMNYLKPAEKEIQLAKQYGIELSANTIKTKGFAGAVGEMIEKTKGNEDALTQMIGEVRGIRGTFALGSDGLQMYNKDLIQLKNSAGTVDRVFSTQTKSWDMQLKNFKNTVNDLALSFGQVLMPKIMEMLSGIKPLVSNFADASDAVKSFQIDMAMLAAIAPIATIAFGGLLNALGGIVGGITSVLTGIKLLRAGLMAGSGFAAALAAAGTSIAAFVTGIVGIVAVVGLAIVAIKKYKERIAKMELEKQIEAASREAKEYLFLAESVDAARQAFKVYQEEVKNPEIRMTAIDASELKSALAGVRLQLQTVKTDQIVKLNSKLFSFNEELATLLDLKKKISSGRADQGLATSFITMGGDQRIAELTDQISTLTVEIDKLKKADISDEGFLKRLEEWWVSDVGREEAAKKIAAVKEVLNLSKIQFNAGPIFFDEDKVRRELAAAKVPQTTIDSINAFGDALNGLNAVFYGLPVMQNMPTNILEFDTANIHRYITALSKLEGADFPDWADKLEGYRKANSELTAQQEKLINAALASENFNTALMILAESVGYVGTEFRQYMIDNLDTFGPIVQKVIKYLLMMPENLEKLENIPEIPDSVIKSYLNVSEAIKGMDDALSLMPSLENAPSNILEFDATTMYRYIDAMKQVTGASEALMFEVFSSYNKWYDLQNAILEAAKAMPVAEDGLRLLAQGAGYFGEEFKKYLIDNFDSFGPKTQKVVEDLYTIEAALADLRAEAEGPINIVVRFDRAKEIMDSINSMTTGLLGLKSIPELIKMRGELRDKYAGQIAYLDNALQSKLITPDEYDLRMASLNKEVDDLGEGIRTIYEESTKAAGGVDKMKEALSKAAGVIAELLGQGSGFSKGLHDEIGQGPLAPGANGPFEDIFRLQAWLNDGTWGNIAEKTGFDRGRIEQLVKDFQMGNFTPDVIKMINTDQLVDIARMQLIAEKSKEVLAEKLAKESGLDKEIFSGLLGIKKDQSGKMKLPDNFLDLPAVQTKLSEDASKLPGNATMLSALIGAAGSGVQDTAQTVSDSVNTAFLGVVKSDADKYAKVGEEMYVGMEGGIIKKASESTAFYNLIETMVFNALTKK